jgi:hypothetical protein
MPEDSPRIKLRHVHARKAATGEHLRAKLKPEMTDAAGTEILFRACQRALAKPKGREGANAPYAAIGEYLDPNRT